MQLPNSPEKEKQQQQQKNLPAQLLKSNGKTKQSLRDGANGRQTTWQHQGGSSHYNGSHWILPCDNQPISSFSPLLRQVTNMKIKLIKRNKNNTKN